MRLGVVATHAEAAVVVVVLLAAIVHAVWNALIKNISDQVVAFGLMGITFAVVAPVILGLAGPPAGASIPFAIASGMLQIAYCIGLMQCYRIGSFNQTYPLARGTSPLLVALGALIFANEDLSVIELVGVAVLAAGLASLVFSSGRPLRSERPALLAAVLTGVAIASYTLVDGIGVRRAHDPYAYAALLFAIQGPALALGALWLRRKKDHIPSKTTVLTGLFAGALSLLAYGAVVWAQTRGALAAVAALRETSVIVGAAIGAVFFGEKFGHRRILAAVVVSIGVVLISG